MPGELPASARVDADARVAVGNPLLGIDGLPGLVPVGRTCEHVRVLGSHPVPLDLVSLLERRAPLRKGRGSE